MKKVKDVYILEEAFNDLDEGRFFYDLKETGIGDYFWDCLISDIESLIIHAGIHKAEHGLYRTLAKRFPYAIYYEIIENIAYVIAVLPMRRDPAWISEKIKERQ